MSSIYNELIGMQNATAYTKAEEASKKGPVQELNQDAFLMLMMEQMKHQDPMEPMDNSQMLAQQAQFTQISELQKMNESISANNQVMQGSALIGKTVSVFDPDDNSKVITGVVTEANFSSSGVSIVVNGKSFPLSHVFSASNATPPDTTTESESDDDAKAA